MATVIRVGLSVLPQHGDFAEMRRAMATATGAASFHLLDASRIANAVAGQTIAANMIMLGYAYQIGSLPLSAESIERAIELNGEAAAMNKAAFRWGRYAAADAAAVEKLVAPGAVESHHGLSQTLDEMVERRAAFSQSEKNDETAQKQRIDAELPREGNATRRSTGSRWRIAPRAPPTARMRSSNPSAREARA